MSDPCDFPAAHSMDTMWFAVDRDGHVAAFESGEAGAVPTAAYTDDWGPIADELVRAAPAAAPAAPAPADDDPDDGDRAAALAAAGVFVYRHDDYDNWIAGPYQRAHAPAAPLPGHRVPRGLLAQMASFDGRFADTEQLQPVEHWPSDAWGAAWMASDGKHVRCIPGHEADYASELANLDGVLPADVAIEPAGASAAPPPTARTVTRPWWQFWKRR